MAEQSSASQTPPAPAAGVRPLSQITHLAPLLLLLLLLQGLNPAKAIASIMKEMPKAYA